MKDESLKRAERRPRRDAEANRDRLLAAAVMVMLREGRNVPLATIAAEAGVGVGTLYRKYRDRAELMQALEHRAYGLLNAILDEIEEAGPEMTGLDLIGCYLARTIEIGDQLVLPLHGAPPLVDDEAVRARGEINRRLNLFIERGIADGSVRPGVTATDIIAFAALVTQPLMHGPDWPTLVERQRVIFLNGMAASATVALPERSVSQGDVERTLSRRAAQAAGPGEP